MTEAVHTRPNRQTDEELTSILRDKDYKTILDFLDTNWRYTFQTEQSGETFENWIDWCAQKSGNVEDAKQILLQLFARFYKQLPLVPKANLSYLADEIGYTPTRARLLKIKYFYKDLFASITTALRSTKTRARRALVSMRTPHLPQVQVAYFRRPSAQRSSYMPIEDLIKSSHRSIRS
jgi:hypothetical protein